LIVKDILIVTLFYYISFISLGELLKTTMELYDWIVIDRGV